MERDGPPTGESREEGTRRVTAEGAGLALAVVVFVAHGWLLHGSTGRDDVHITYWAAHSLLEHGEILNYNGAVYEQSSTLLHTLLLALAGWLTSLPLTMLGPVISIGAGLATLWLSWRLARELGVRRPSYAPLLTALLGYFIYWSFSGMETSVTAALVLGSVVILHRWLETGERRWALATGGVLAGFVTVRPESGIVLVTALVTYMVLRRLAAPGAPGRHTGRELGVLAGGLSILGALTLWRFWHFGMPMPGPVLAKVSGIDLHRLFQGFLYLRAHGWVLHVVGLVLAATYGLIGANRESGRVGRLGWLAAALVLAYAAFAVASGGDWMEGGRLLVPALPLVAVLAAKGLDTLSTGRRTVSALLAVLLTIGAVLFAANSSTGYPGPVAERTYAPVFERTEAEPLDYSWWEKANRVHLRDIPTIAAMELLLSESTPDGGELTVWSIQGGMVFYHLARQHGDRLHFVDLVGLTTPHLHDCGMVRGHRGTRVGIVLPSYRFLLSRRDQLRRRCGVPRPDVIVDLVKDEHHLSMLRRQGFRIAYRQHGGIEPAFGFLGSPEPADAFIAVREGVEGVPPGRKTFRWP